MPQQYDTQVSKISKILRRPMAFVYFELAKTHWTAREMAVACAAGWTPWDGWPQYRTLEETRTRLGLKGSP